MRTREVTGSYSLAVIYSSGLNLFISQFIDTFHLLYCTILILLKVGNYKFVIRTYSPVFSLCYLFQNKWFSLFLSIKNWVQVILHLLGGCCYINSVTFEQVKILVGISQKPIRKPPEHRTNVVNLRTNDTSSKRSLHTISWLEIFIIISFMTEDSTSVPQGAVHCVASF